MNKWNLTELIVLVLYEHYQNSPVFIVVFFLWEVVIWHISNCKQCFSSSTYHFSSKGLWVVTWRVTANCTYFLWLLQKQNSQNFFKIGPLKDFAKFKGKHLCWNLFFNVVGDLKASNVVKKRFQHSYFPLNFQKLLRTPFFIEHA